MEIVIKIPERDYDLACNYPDALIATYAHYIKDGTLLPKGHGRLIDADDIDNHIVGSVDTRDCPTIIEADKENNYADSN